MWLATNVEYYTAFYTIARGWRLGLQVFAARRFLSICVSSWSHYFITSKHLHVFLNFAFISRRGHFDVLRFTKHLKTKRSVQIHNMQRAMESPLKWSWYNLRFELWFCNPVFRWGTILWSVVSSVDCGTAANWKEAKTKSECWKSEEFEEKCCWKRSWVSKIACWVSGKRQCFSLMTRKASCRPNFELGHFGFAVQHFFYIPVNFELILCAAGQQMQHYSLQLLHFV